MSIHVQEARLPRQQVKLISESSAMKKIVGIVPKLSRCDIPILLLGETGTGKGLLARVIHEARSHGPFVTVDCASMVGPLMESELFGHSRGAFTGAVTSKPGLLEIAEGGTVFLDEIGELPLDLQSKLLRVIQDREYRAVGSVVPRRADFRVIAATNRDLAREVERGAFRADLYFRLKVITVRLPALRERKQDIPLLMSDFLRRYGKTHSMTNETIEALFAYDWPGNIRELENCILQMVSMNSGPLLHSADLPSNVQNAVMSRKLMAASAVAGAGASECSRQSDPEAIRSRSSFSLEAIEKQTIREALEFSNGDRVKASYLLGIGRTTLYRKLKEYKFE